MTHTPYELKPLRLARPLLALICLAALAVRYWGIDWSSQHPDEPTIAGWVSLRQDQHHIKSRFYAEGFFTLMKPVHAFHAWAGEQRHRWDYFRGASDALHKPDVDELILAREFNAWLAVLTVLFLYGLVRDVSRSRAMGLLGAAWLALSPLHIQHSHYAETDVAMLMALVLSLWLWVRYLERGGRWRFAGAAVVTGFAMGTKFTLLPLVFCLLVAPWVGAGGVRLPMRSRIVRTVVGLVLCLGGLLLSNPGITDWKWFQPQVKAALASVYGERAGLLNDSGDRWLPVVANWRVFQMGWSTLAWPWILLIGVGVLTSLRRPFRSAWPVTLVFPAAFLVYFFLIAPWVRGQEFMILLPSLGIWAALGLVSWWHWTSTMPVRGIWRWGLATVVVAWAVGDLAVGAMRQGSMFAWPDPRAMALEWFRLHAPPSRTIGVSPYTGQAFRFKHAMLVDIGQVERTPVNEIRAQGVDYVIRNPLSHGRGTVDVVTGRRLPEFEACWQGFTAEARRVWEWTPVEGPLFRFECMPLEYWTFIRQLPEVSFGVLPLYQPGYVGPGSRQGVWPFVLPIGSAKMAEVTHYGGRWVVGGPAEEGRTVYVVLQTLDRGATISVRGLGCSERVRLAPHAVEVVTLKRAWYAPRLDACDIVSLQAEPQKHVESIPCYAEVAVSPDVVACRLLAKGYPDRALDFAKGEESRGHPLGSTWPVFVAASELGDREVADRLRPRVVALQGKIREALAAEEAGVEIGGLSGVVYDDHSRIRLEPASFVLTPEEGQKRGAPPLMSADVDLPLRPAKGVYELSFDVALARQALAPGVPAVVRVSVDGSKAREVDLRAEGKGRLVFPIRRERERGVSIRLESSAVLDLHLQDIELRWRLKDSLSAMDLEITRALARGAALAGGVPAEGLLRYPDDRVLKRLAGGAGGGRLPEGGGEWIPVDQEFHPFVRLTGVRYDDATKQLDCRFLVLRDDAPTPVAVLSRSVRLSRRWKTVSSAELSDRPFLHAGDGVTVELAMPTGARPPFAGLGLSLSTNPRWLPEDYAVAGRPETKVRLEEWFGARRQARP